MVGWIHSYRIHFIDSSLFQLTLDFNVKPCSSSLAHKLIILDLTRQLQQVVHGKYLTISQVLNREAWNFIGLKCRYRNIPLQDWIFHQWRANISRSLPKMRKIRIDGYYHVKWALKTNFVFEYNHNIMKWIKWVDIVRTQITLYI